jgi:hypothetical protein
MRTPPPLSAQTRPTYYDGYAANGGLGVIGRRGWDARTQTFIEQAAQSGIVGLSAWAELAPLRLLDVLATLHPAAQMADSTDAALCFGPEDTRIVAVKDYRQGKGVVDDEMTQVVSQLWKAYAKPVPDTPDAPVLTAEVNGLMMLQQTLLWQVDTAGMYCLEAVPGGKAGSSGSGGGIADINDFAPLSVRWKLVEKPDGRHTTRGGKRPPTRVLEQYQPGKDGGWKELDLSTVMAVAWKGSRDNPYGKPRKGAFLSEGLADIARRRSLRDWLHAAAWPRLAIGFPIEQVIQYAKDNPDVLVGKGKDGADLTPYEFARAEMNAFQQTLSSMKSDDTLLMPGDADKEVLNASNISGLAEVLRMERIALAQSLDQFPGMLGYVEGGTQAYNEVQLKAQAQKYESLRAFINGGPVAIANLHLRLLGVDMICRAESKPILLSDLLAYYQAEGQRINNAFSLLDRGVTSPEETAIDLSGTGMYDESRAYSQPIAPTVPPTGGGNNNHA